ncbi:MAG: Mor transcription activator family protein [Betaproteobacteria bacterium]
MSENYPELLEDFATGSAELLRAEGLPEDLSRTLGNKIADFLCDHWGGQAIYVPFASHRKIALRNAEIYRKFNGKNQAALSTEFKVSLIHIYRILKKMNELARKKDNSPAEKG